MEEGEGCREGGGGGMERRRRKGRRSRYCKCLCAGPSTQVLSHPWITSRDSLPDHKLAIQNHKMKVRDNEGHTQPSLCLIQ